jgi:hypothetical protein
LVQLSAKHLVLTKAKQKEQRMEFGLVLELAVRLEPLLEISKASTMDYRKAY